MCVSSYVTDLGSVEGFTMTNFENNNSSFKDALESSHVHSPKFLDEAMQIHQSLDLKSTEDSIAANYPDHKYEAMRVHLTLLAAANSDVAKADPTLQASIYRDIAVQDQAIALAKLKTFDIAGADKLLRGWEDNPTSAKGSISKAESLDPGNKDLEQLHLIQDQLTAQVDGMKSIRPAIRHLNTDAIGATLAKSIDNNWNDAMGGSVQAAAEVQHFADRAGSNGDPEILAKIYQNLDPHVAEQVRKAAQSHDTVRFE